MLIDWFTVIAQVINFLVLVWLLKRFLYRPILNAINAREKRIATELANADATKAEAEKKRDEFEQKNAEFDKQRTTRMNTAMEEAKAERVRSLEAVRVESEQLCSKLKSALANEQLTLKEALNQRTQEEVFAIARKTLSDLAETTLEARMAEVFIARLQELSSDDLDGLKSALQKSTQALTVRTAFVLPKEQRALVESAIEKVLGEKKQIQFVTAADLVSGIEINANGQKIGWSISEYLGALEKSIDQVLQTSSDIQSSDDVLKTATTEQGSHENSA